MRRPGKRTLLLLGAGGLLVPAILLSLLGVKLLRDFAEIGGTVRQEYGDYIASIAASSLEDALLELEQENMVAARFVPPETPEELVEFLDRFQRENRLYRMAFLVVPEGLVHYASIERERSTGFRPLPEWIHNSILATLLRQGRVPSGLLHLADPDPENPVQVTYFTLESGSGKLLGAAGFIWDLEEIRSDPSFLDRTLGRDLLREKNLFRGAFFESPMVVAILDQHGEPIYRTVEAHTPGYITRRSLDRVLPFYEVGVQLQDDRFNEWVNRVVRTSLAMIVVMLAVIVLALAGSLRYVLREIELAELKSTFVSNVSHELKTPLALIRLFSETLEMGRVESEEKAKEFLRIIGKESERLTHLINNVLDVGRIEQGRKSYDLAPTDLPALVRDTLSSYEYPLRREGFVVESEIDADLPPMLLDAGAITQALLNLLENAIKYSDRDRRLRVEVHRRDGEAVIRVRDRGMGIPAGEQDRIFEKFYRVEKGLVHTVKGSGLGLSLVKHIVDAHGGSVRVESRAGEGSTFTIRLPIRRPEGPATDGVPGDGDGKRGDAS